MKYNSYRNKSSVAHKQSKIKSILAIALIFVFAAGVVGTIAGFSNGFKDFSKFREAFNLPPKEEPVPYPEGVLDAPLTLSDFNRVNVDDDLYMYTSKASYDLVDDGVYTIGSTYEFQVKINGNLMKAEGSILESDSGFPAVMEELTFYFDNDGKQIANDDAVEGDNSLIVCWFFAEIPAIDGEGVTLEPISKCFVLFSNINFAGEEMTFELYQVSLVEDAE